MSFLIAASICESRHGPMTVSGIWNRVALNPLTATNDRAQVAVEFAHDLDTECELVFLIQRDSDRFNVFNGRFVWVPGDRDGANWIVFTLPSLAKTQDGGEPWRVGDIYHFAIKGDDEILCVRSMLCVSDADTPGELAHGRDQ